jgi:hypothetical protein
MGDVKTSTHPSGICSRRLKKTGLRPTISFKPEAKHWLVEKGDFVLHLALSATQILASLPVSRQTTLMLPV